MPYDEYYRARAAIIEFLRKDLLGPVSDNEVIADPNTWPDDYYITGILYPQGNKIGQEEMEVCVIGDKESEEIEQPMNLCYSNHPSSIAISFSIKHGVEKLLVETEYAWYEPIEKEAAKENKRPLYEWHRHSGSKINNIDLNVLSEPVLIHPGLELRTYLQKLYNDGSKTITIALINTNQDQRNRLANNARTFFQPKIKVRGEEGAIFIEKQLRVKMSNSEEVRNLEMLYKHNRIFAIGHGCSAEWTADGDTAVEIRTEFLPTHELMQMRPALRTDENTLSFNFLGEAPREEVVSGLNRLADSYETWISEQKEKSLRLVKEYRDVGQSNLKLCEESLKRIREGIDLLLKEDLTFIAFQFVNQAMLDQRSMEHKDENLSSHKWYPFQLAFILQELCSIAHFEDSYREVVDLLWFPTGGGKTEAYLGLTAFTIFLRRMRAIEEGTSGHGVTVLMRYTLRLLTMQQFQRASSLICACELLRGRNQKRLGTEEIAIGMWVGGGETGLTPNKRSYAIQALEVIAEAGYEALKPAKLANPCQVLKCPRCNAIIGPQHYSVTLNKMVISCPNKDCDFKDGLPLYLIDEDIYEQKPALVVATVDKFARMTWEPKVGNLFAINEDFPPPELIIQDELHLISGPLGTMAGLYEVAVDEFCTRDNIRAKIIASTATIRNTENQVLNLYGRSFRQFPPSSIDIRDSFFAEEAIRDDRPSRLYMGILAPGASGAVRLIRVYSILIFATRYLERQGYSQEVIDSYWTLVGYFNSLKELGGANFNVRDDVSGRLKYLVGTKFRGLFPLEDNPFDYLEMDELTSRKDSAEIGKILERVEEKYPSPIAYDLILASNMLSVGIDIGRLGLMAIQGQPKSNSEYIQATSRVGRQTPGLVITMYDASRSRDRSHYELFQSYHSSLYRFVEATSVTPFAERARDRALHAVLISLCRHLISALKENKAAGMVPVYEDQAENYIETILKRVKIIDSEEYGASKNQLYGILEKWIEKSGPDLAYQKYYNQKVTPLLTDKFDTKEDRFPTLNSMRNIDVGCRVLLLE